MTQFQRIALLLLSLFVLQIFTSTVLADEKPEKKMMTVTVIDQKTVATDVLEKVASSLPSTDTVQQAEVAKVEDKPKEENIKEEISKEENKPKEEEKPKEDYSKEEKPKEQEEKKENIVKTNMKQADGENSQHKTSVGKKSHKAEVHQSDHQEEDHQESEPQGSEDHHNSEHHENEHMEEQYHEEAHDLEHHHEEEHGIPFDDYMGEEIDQYLDHEDHDPSATEEDEPSAVSGLEEEESLYASASVSSEEAIAADAVNKTQPTTPTGPRPPVPQVTGCKTQGQIALTYSEGPSDVTAKIVRQLTKADARANFFVNATWLYTQQYAMVVQNIYKAGHFIGMTYRAHNDDPNSMTDDQIRQDIISNAHTIESLINVAPKYVRLHYTEVKDVRTEGILNDLGFVIVGYNMDSQDYFKKDATGPGSINQVYEDTFVKYKDTYDAKGSFISIQYDLPYTGSLAAIPHIINTIDKEGYTMVRLDGCLNDPTPYKKTANGTEYVSDKYSFSQSGYHQGQKSVTIESPAEAAEADEEFSMQGFEVSMANTQQVSTSFILVIVGVAFTFFL